MTRRQPLTTLAAMPAATQIHTQTAPAYHLRPGLVAYSYRKEMAAKTMTYDSLIRKIAEWGLDGLDCTVYWFPDTSAEFLASLRKALSRAECRYTTRASACNFPSLPWNCSSPSTKISKNGSM